MIMSEEIQYIFYVENLNKYRKYISIINDAITFNPIMTDASRFTLFNDGYDLIKRFKLREGVKLGYVKMVTSYEFREMKS